jgi:hypothetical protein
MQTKTIDTDDEMQTKTIDTDGFYYVLDDASSQMQKIVLTFYTIAQRAMC